MTKQELEQAIENGESVWCSRRLEKIKLDRDYYIYDDLLENRVLGIAYFIKELFKTKAEAEHYLHHANITRTEELLFLTWEEFLKQKDFVFYDKNREEYCLNIEQKYIWLYGGDYARDWNLTEENFYKAYDECVRLFRGGE